MQLSGVTLSSPTTFFYAFARLATALKEPGKCREESRDDNNDNDNDDDYGDGDNDDDGDDDDDDIGNVVHVTETLYELR